MKGLWIPIKILHDNNLTMQEKLLMCEINQLEMLDKGCIASNKHFGEKLNISAKSVSNTISSLVAKGYIKSQIIEGSRNMQREIFTIHKYGNYYPQNMERVSTKHGETKERNTKSNKDNNNSSDSAESLRKFELIWTAYEKHGSKKQALDAFKKLKLDRYSESQLLEAIKSYKQGKEVSYTKHFQRFLRDEIGMHLPIPYLLKDREGVEFSGGFYEYKNMLVTTDGKKITLTTDQMLSAIKEGRAKHL